MADTFANFAAGLTSPAEHAVAITPNDGADLANSTRGIYVGVTGNIKITTSAGDDVTFAGLAAGIIHPIRARRVWATGTTATSIVGVY